jgi:hypothetical protein
MKGKDAKTLPDGEHCSLRARRALRPSLSLAALARAREEQLVVAFRSHVWLVDACSEGLLPPRNKDELIVSYRLLFSSEDAALSKA